MSKSGVHAILGELHKLLATYKSSDFIEASNYKGTSRLMRTVLRTLAHEAEPSAGNIVRRSFRVPIAHNYRSKQRNAPTERAQILNLIRRSKLFESTRSIVVYANNRGLRLVAKPKESKERLANRLCTLIEQLPEREKSEVISDLLGGKNSQTQGWIDLITSGKQ